MGFNRWGHNRTNIHNIIRDNVSTGSSSFIHNSAKTSNINKERKRKKGDLSS